MVDFPTGVPDIPDAVGSNPLSTMHTSESHSVSTNRILANLEALATKLGTGSSTAAADQVLRGTGAGVTSFGQVATAMLAANAVSQVSIAVGSTSDPTTTSTGAFVLIPQMTITMTTTGGPLLAWFNGRFKHGTASNLIGTAPYLDSALQADGERTHNFAGVDYQTDLGWCYVWTPSAGSHTVEARWYTSGGTATALSTCRTLILAELKR